MVTSAVILICVVVMELTGELSTHMVDLRIVVTMVAIYLLMALVEPLEATFLLMAGQQALVAQLIQAMTAVQ